MPFVRPSLGELVTRIRNDLRGRLEGDGPLVRRAMADVLGAVWGHAAHELHAHLAWLALQLFVRTAEREALLRMAEVYGITPTAAQFARGNLTATGAGIIPAGRILRLDTATTYRVTTGTVVTASGTSTVPVVATVSGVASNLPAGATLTLESPISGVSSTLTVAAGGITGGIDMEGLKDVRARLILRLREPPQGGADHDYIAWALAAPGVTRAWVFGRELGLGTVVVRTVNDDALPIFPDAAAVAVVQAVLDAQRPITAVVTAAAPTPLSVPFTIRISPDNADTRAAVTAELTDLLQRVAEPGDGAGRGKVLLSQVRTAIGVAAGVTDYSLPAPSTDVVPGVGQLPVLGAIQWV